MTQKLIKAKSRTKSRKATNGGLAAKVALVEKDVTRALPDFSPGDTVKVMVRIKEGDKERLQAYEGVCIKKGNRGSQKSFTVRKMSHGVGVERVFLESSPKVASIEVLTRGKVRRAKLYYLRGLEGKAAKIDRKTGPKAEVSREA